MHKTLVKNTGELEMLNRNLEKLAKHKDVEVSKFPVVVVWNIESDAEINNTWTEHVTIGQETFNS